MHGVNANDGLNFVRYKYKHMANRNNTHESIAALTAQISQLNADLKTRNDVSVLDIDLLRKHTIDLYEEVNRLRLVMKEKTADHSPLTADHGLESTKIKEEPIAVSPKVEKETPVPELVEEIEVEAPVSKPVEEIEAEAPVSKPVEEIEVEAPVSEPVEEEAPTQTQNPEPETPAAPVSEPVEEETPARTQNPEPNTSTKPVSEPVEEETPSEEKVLAAEAKVEADAIKGANNEEEANDLAHKFSNTPINDLKKAISIAKKFEFINALFAGNVEKYAYSIHHMNNLTSGDEAFSYLHDLRSEHKWDDEDKNFLELANLVRRRYLG